MKLLKHNFTYILKKPSLLINKCTIKDHFNLNHGAFFLDNAIKLLEANEQDKFQNYLNGHEFNPHNLFICKNISLIRLHIILKFSIGYLNAKKYSKNLTWIRMVKKEFMVF